MWKKIVLFFFIQFSFISVIAIQRPPFIDACHRNDPNLNACAMKSASRAIPILTQGDNTYHIPNMKPMHIDSIKIPPITNLKMTLKNITVKGLDTTVPHDFKLNLTSQDMTFKVNTSLLAITGQYTLGGRLLIFPVEGQGLANITYVDGIYTYQMHYELSSRKNIEYINITKHSVVFTPKRAYFYFENLFNGNKALSEQILHFINENWEEVNKDFGAIVAQAIDAIVTATANAILGRVPYDDVFLK